MLNAPEGEAHVIPPAEGASMTRDAWAILIAVTLAWIFDAVDSTIYSLTIPSIKDEFQINMTAMGWIGTAFMAGSAIGALLMPVLAERYGRRWGMAGCILLYSIFTSLVGLSHSTTTVAGARLLTGIGTGGEWPVGAAYLADVVPAKKRGFLMGIMQSGYPVGYFLAGLIFAAVTSLGFGWRMNYYIMIIPGILLLPVLLHVRESPVWLATHTRFSKAVQADSRSGADSKTERASYKSLLHTEHVGSTLRATLVQFCGNFYGWAINIWLPSAFMLDFGVSKTETAFMIMLMWGIGIFGYIGSGYLQDIVGRRFSYSAYMVVALVVTSGLCLAKISGFQPPLVLLYAAAVILGLTMGEATIRITYTSEIFRPSVRGIGIGFSVGVAKLLVMFCPALLGAMAERTSVSAALVAASVVGVLSIPVLYSGPETGGWRVLSRQA